MLAKEMIIKKFEYNHWANKKLLEHATKITPEQWGDDSIEYSRGNIHQTMHHILIVEEMWLAMCEHHQRPTDLPTPETLSTPESLIEYSDKVQNIILTYLNTLDEEKLKASFESISPNGKTYSLVIWHILNHVLYHSAQHRSEVAELLTRYGQSPGDIDFIFFV